MGAIQSLMSLMFISVMFRVYELNSLMSKGQFILTNFGLVLMRKGCFLFVFCKILSIEILV